MKTLSRYIIILTVLLTLLFPMLARPAIVTLKTADASGSTSFTGSTNWSNGAVPGSGNDYLTTTTVILNTSGLRTPPDANNYTFGGNSLTFTWPGNGNYSLIEKSSAASGAGRTLTINNFTNAGGLMRSGGTVGSIITINGNQMTVSSNSTILADQCNWIINSPMVGTGIITNNFASAQTVTFGGNNANFGGKILINGITLFSAQTAVPGNPVFFMPDQIILGTGGTLRDNIGITLNNANAGVTLYGNGAVNTVNATSNTIIAEPITGAFSLTRTGAGILTLAGSNSYSGGFVMSGATAGGQLNINSTNALGANAGTFTISGGDLSKLDNTSGSPITNLANNVQSWGNNFSFVGSSSLNLGTGLVFLGGARTITNNASTLTLGGSVVGAFGLTKMGAGTLVLAASNAFTGGLTISAGTVIMANTNALGTNGMTFAGTANATLDVATDGADYTNVVNAGSGTTWTLASDVKTGSVGINHTLGAFLIGSGSPALQMNVVAGPAVLSGSPQISSASVTLSGGSGGTTIIAPTTAGVSFGTVTATATSKILQLDGTNQNNTITGGIANGGANLISVVKTNTSRWTLGGPGTYTGNTTIGQGTFALSGSGSIASTNILLGSAGVLDVSAATSFALTAAQALSGSGTVNGNFADSATSQIYPGGAGSIGNLIFNGNVSLSAGDTNSFDFATGVNDQYIIAGSLTPAVGSVINLGTLPAGGLPNGTYTLMQVSGTLGGSAGNFVVTGKPSPSRQTFTIIYTPGTPNLVQLQVNGSSANLTWFGTSSAWDLVTTADWTNAVSQSTDFYFDGDNVNFTDLGSAISPILNVNVQPGSVTVNSANAYTLSGTGSINGSTGLTKSGNGTLTIQNTNSYTGVTTLSAGTVSISTITNGGLASPIGAASSAPANIVFNGGTLQYTSGDTPSTDRGATLNSGGGTIQLSSSTSALTLNGVIAGATGGGLTKSGNGTLIMNGANMYNGSTTISGGVLQLGNGGTTGNPGSGAIADNTSLVALRSSTLTLSNNISGTGNIIENGTGTLVLAGTNTYVGETLINTGLVQVVSAHGLGSPPAAFDPAHIYIGTELEASTSFSLSDTNSGVNIPSGTIGVDSGVTFVISNEIVSTNSLTKALPGTLILSGSNTFTGVLNIDTASQTASDGALRVTSTNALGGVQTINVRNNQGPASSTLQMDGTYGVINVAPATWTWSGRNNLVPAIENITGNNIWNPSTSTLNAGGFYYMFQCDAGSLTLPGAFPTGSPVGSRGFSFDGPGTFSVSGGIQSGGCTNLSVFVTNNATVTYWTGNSYTGMTSLQGGTLDAADGSSFGTSIANIEIAPYTNEVATLNISNAYITAQRIIVAGVTGNNTSPGTGVVNQMNGVVNASQWVTIGSGGTLGGTGTYNLSGNAQLYVQNTAGGTQMEIANFTGSSGTLNVSGSSVLEIQNSAYISMGANAGAGNGTVNQSGGTVTFYSDSGGTVGGAGILYLGKAAGLTGNYVYNLDGGTLQAPTITSVSGNSLFYFNGGILEAAETNANFMTGLTAAYDSTNGATIDSGSSAVTIAQPLLHDPALGAATDGGLTNQSASLTGTLTLTGTNTYTGPTVINSGALNINGSIGSGAVTINGGTLGGSGVVNGATALVTGTNAPGGSGAIGTLTINNNFAVQGGTLQFDMNRSSNDVLAVSGAVNITAPATILLAFPSPDVGTYTLVTYGSLTGFGNLSVALTSPNPRFSYSLNNNVGTKTIQLVVTGNSANLVWKGDGSFNGWDNAGQYQNWLNGASADYFYDGDNVTFNNSGSDTPSIYLTTTVSPSSVTVNATQNYDFAGFGLIGGAGTLTKSGSGTLTLEDNNSYSGTTLINAGMIQVGNGNTTGTLGSGAISNNASLTFDRSDAIVLPSTIYGTGSVTLADGNVTASGSNNYTGSTFVNSGISFLSNAAGFGATNGTITVASGAQVYLTANVNFGANPLSLVGVGDGNGALRKGAAGVSAYAGALTLTGNTSISVDGSATLDLTGASGINGAAANANLTLFGAGVGAVSGPIVLGTGGLTVTTGTWEVAPSNSFTGLASLNGGTLQVTGGSLGTPATFTADQINLSGGNFEAVTNVTFNDGNSGFTLNANATFIVDSGYTLTISNQIAGSFTLTKSSPGTLVLNGNNPFDGTLNVDTASTTASDGIVQIASPNAVANIPASVGTPTIIQRDNNGGSSTIQLNATNGNLVLPQELQSSCRNVAVANFENLNGSNTLSGNIDVQSGGGTVYFQSDAGTLNLAGNVQYVGTLNGARTYTFTGAGNHLVSGVITGPVNTNAPINVAMSGTGTLILASANTYSNTTTVNSGTMLINGSITTTGGVTVNGGTLGGTGVINDVVSVASGGTLSPGAGGIGTLTINSNLTLSGVTYIEVNKQAGTRDQVAGVNNLSYGGTLFATNLAGTSVIGDSYTIFNALSPGGNFASITGSPGPGLAWSFNPTSGVLSVVNGVVPISYLKFIGSPVLSGTSMTFSVTNSGGGTIRLFTSTNLMAPLSTWTPIWTNSFGASGIFTTNIANAVNPVFPQQFYQLTGSSN